MCTNIYKAGSAAAAAAPLPIGDDVDALPVT